MNPFPTDKPSLRRQMRQLRDAIPDAQRRDWSAAIARQVLELPEVRGAACVFCYVSFGSEVDTRGLLDDLLAMSKRVAVPRVVGPQTMFAQPIASLDDLRPGRMGIPQPIGDPVEVDADVALVPGLAFTARGDRLGFGAGHYDRWLAAHPQTRAVGLCFPPQLVDRLPTEPHDATLARVVVP